MASILLLRRRIKAAQNVSKTTRAMQMISASKLKKAQDKTLSIRPYVDKLTTLANWIVEALDELATSPYLSQPKMLNKTLLIALAPDKGLCGGLITNLLRELYTFRKAEKNSLFLMIGKKMEAQITYLKNEVVASFTFGNIVPGFDMVYPIVKIIDEYYLGRKVDSVKILSMQFVSIFTQAPKITTLLPLELLDKQQKETASSQTLFEPNISEILPTLLKRYIEMTIYRNLLESFLSEQAARMIAMQNATNNASDIITDLQLEYNKTRQAAITSEILDISSGGVHG